LKANNQKEFLMRKRNWSKYNRNLVQRGSITFLFDEKTLKEIRNFKGQSTGGRPGFSESVFNALNKWFAVPDYSTVCKRAKELSKELPKLSSRKPLVVLVDSSGIKVFGEGEWKRKIHGPGRKRKWLKMHILVDEKTQEIIAEELTDCRIADYITGKDLIEKAPKSIKTVKGDGGYDKQPFRNAVRKKGATGLIPPQKNGRIKGEDPSRDDAILTILGLGGDLLGRSLWGKLTGYSRRALVETAFSRYKRLFTNRLFSKTFERQRVENRLKWAILNRMSRA